MVTDCYKVTLQTRVMDELSNSQCTDTWIGRRQFKVKDLERVEVAHR